MAKKLYEETNIQAIADAIREKNGESTTYKTSEMADAISAIATGEGGGGIEVEPIVLTDGCDYACAGDIASTYIKLFGDTISTKDIRNMPRMFYGYKNDNIPFDINVAPTASSCEGAYMFYSSMIKTVPKIKGNWKPYNLNNMFMNSKYIREIPEDFYDEWNLDGIATATNAYVCNSSYIFSSCYSLRKFPMKMFQKTNPLHNHSYTYLSNFCDYCHSLDELVDLPLPYTVAWNSNALGSTVSRCTRLKKFTFATQEDGSPIVMKWKSQNLDLSGNVGYALGYYRNNILNYNSGITADKEVTGNTTYQALKNDPDWFTCNVAYSRYNHDSAVETINSLPDTSAYLATAGGTNTIKFYGSSGSATDGGAINTMTEEEIAVAAAKGWTVTFA